MFYGDNDASGAGLQRVAIAVTEDDARQTNMAMRKLILNFIETSAVDIAFPQREKFESAAQPDGEVLENPTNSPHQDRLLGPRLATRPPSTDRSRSGARPPEAKDVLRL